GREQVDGGELLPHAHRVFRPQHGHGARHPDPLSRLGRSCEHDARGGTHKVATVMLAHSKDVETDLVGNLRQLDRLPGSLMWSAERAADGIPCYLAKGHDANLECHRLCPFDSGWD